MDTTAEHRADEHRTDVASDEPPVLTELGSVTEMTLGNRHHDTRDMRHNDYF